MVLHESATASPHHMVQCFDCGQLWKCGEIPNLLAGRMGSLACVMSVLIFDLKEEGQFGTIAVLGLAALSFHHLTRRLFGQILGRNERLAWHSA